MIQNVTKHIVHSYFKKLIKYVSEMENEFDEDNIHLFRVNVKKLRAFLRMMRLDAKDPDKLKFPPQFKKMYSLTGKIRDKQLHLKRVTENKLHKEVQGAEMEINELKKEKDKLLSRAALKKIETIIIENLLTEITPGLIKTFFQQKIDTVLEIIDRKSYKDEELHEVRKSIKDIIFIIKIFRDDIKTPLPFLFWNKSEQQKAEDLAHTLGLFNDTCVALSFFKAGQKTDEKQKKDTNALRRQWLAEKRRLKEKAIIEMAGIKWSFD